MGTLLERFRRTRKGLPCPVCEHSDWCMVEFDGSGDAVRVLCQRTPSGRRWSEAGWLHVLRDDSQTTAWPRVTVLRTTTPSVATHERMRRAHERLLSGDHVARASRELGVAPQALVALGAGIEWRTLLFPMKDDQGRLIGIRTRSAAGEKRSARGSRNGLFLPSVLARDVEVYVCEGPTDTAALLGLGLDAIGLASAGTCTGMAARLVVAVAPHRVVVVGDNDSAGRRSSLAVARALRVVARDVRVIAPPSELKDAREWVRAGTPATSVRAVVEASERVGLILTGGGS